MYVCVCVWYICVCVWYICDVCDVRDALERKEINVLLMPYANDSRHFAVGFVCVCVCVCVQIKFVYM